jgi:hypothetical protein
METTQDFVDALNAKFGGGFTVQAGRKFNRIVRNVYGQNQVYCFTDNEGIIFKAEGWKKPAKRVRNTIKTVNMNSVDIYTSWLYL